MKWFCLWFEDGTHQPSEAGAVRDGERQTSVGLSEGKERRTIEGEWDKIITT